MDEYGLVTYGKSRDDVLKMPGVITCEFDHGTSSFETWVITCEERYLTLYILQGLNIFKVKEVDK